jgi:HSP20 family molecular chaperone IbpA
MSTPQETGDMLVVTLPVPTTDFRALTVSIEGPVVRVLGPGDFRREVSLPEGADAGGLQAGLFDDILELRAPRAARPSLPRDGEVEVRPLC